MSNIIPNSRPQLDRAGVDKLLEGKVSSQQYPVRLLGVRGYYKQTMGNPLKNDQGIYDDAIFLVWPTAFLSFNANTDPSVDRKGIATLVPGLHLYCKGKHGISRGPGYPALRPATPGERVPVLRNGKPDIAVAINIHRGSLYSTSSEGCQTIYPVQWPDFIGHVYDQMDRYHQAIVPYFLTES